MATVKIKFRPSTVDGGQGSIYYQVIHNRVARQQKTGYRLNADEWGMWCCLGAIATEDVICWR